MWCLCDVKCHHCYSVYISVPSVGGQSVRPRCSWCSSRRSKHTGHIVRKTSIKEDALRARLMRTGDKPCACFRYSVATGRLEAGWREEVIYSMCCWTFTPISPQVHVINEWLIPSLYCVGTSPGALLNPGPVSGSGGSTITSLPCLFLILIYVCICVL